MELSYLNLFLTLVVLVLAILVLHKVNTRKCGGSEGFKYKQNNPSEISQNMSTLPSCQGQNLSATGPAVQCAIALSAYENKFQGDALFGSETGIDDDFAQDAWCCCDKSVQPNTNLDGIDVNYMESLRSHCN